MPSFMFTFSVAFDGTDDEAWGAVEKLRNLIAETVNHEGYDQMWVGVEEGHWEPYVETTGNGTEEE